MPKKSYALEQGGAKRLDVSWKMSWKDFIVMFDGMEVGRMSGQKELREGRVFALPDGSELEVKLARVGISTELQMLRNGKPLSGSASDPRTKLKQAYGLLYFIGGLNVILGLVALIFEVDFLLELGMGIYSLATGAVYLVLAYLVQKRSKAALIAAMVLYGLETVLSFVNGSSSGIIVRILFGFIMWQGFGALKDLESEADEGGNLG